MLGTSCYKRHLHLQRLSTICCHFARKKVQVLSGCGKDDLFKIMDYESLPYFCRRQGSGSSKYARNSTGEDCCFSLDHGFHQQLYNYINDEALGIEPHGNEHRREKRLHRSWN